MSRPYFVGAGRLGCGDRSRDRVTSRGGEGEGEREKERRKGGEEERRRGEWDAPKLVSNLEAPGHGAHVLLARSRVKLQQVAHLAAGQAASRRLGGASVEVLDEVLMVGRERVRERSSEEGQKVNE